MANTHMAASTAMMTWSALEWAFPPTAPFFTGRPTSIGAACGAVVGLVAITPACGYVAIGFGMLIALIAAVCVFFAQRNITFKSNTSIWRAAFWYAVAYVVITFIAARRWSF
jgi:ammonia channel protein AmtB